MSDNRKSKVKGRDARGVRINNYNESTRGRQNVENPQHEEPIILLDTFKRGFFDEVPTGGEAGESVRRRAVGRIPKYETAESFINKVDEYINYINDTFKNTGYELIPDIEGFCSFAGIDRSTLFDWERQRPAPFPNIIKALRTSIAAYKKQLALKGKIPAVVFAIDMNNNHDYIQQQTIDIKTNVQELPSVDDIRKKLPKNSDNSTGSDNDFIEI